MAGGQHHHRTNMDKYHPGYFGKVGMRYFHKTHYQFWKPTLNLDKVCLLLCLWPRSDIGLLLVQLWTLVPAESREKYLTKSAGDAVPVIDLLAAGYAKLLGKGRLPDVPVVVKARYVSALAEKKIKEAGGVIELVA